MSYVELIAILDSTLRLARLYCWPVWRGCSLSAQGFSISGWKAKCWPLRWPRPRLRL